MIRVVEIRANAAGPRLYLLTRRVHHAPLGAIGALVALALRHPRAALILIGYALTDWRDFPWRDRDNH